MIAEVLLSAVTLFSVLFAFLLYESIKEKYIRVNVILKNAVLEALEHAKKHQNTFEIKAYTDLLKKIERKI